MTRPSLDERSVFWGAWAALMLLATAWILGNPLMASPDEPAHTVKAASVVRGQLLGPDGAGGSEVQVPYFYNLVTAYPVCYMFDADATGVCDPEPVEELDAEAVSVTPAGRYNPLYYAIVGLPTLLPPGDGVLYAMRLISAALCTFLLALGLRALAQAPRPAWSILGVAGALTPMVVFLTSTVNPAAVEIAAAFALWCQLLTLLRHPDPGRTVHRMAWIAVSATFLVNARGLSLLYCAVIVAVVLLVSPWSAFVDVVRTRGAWPSLAVIGVACVAAAGWVLGSNSLGSGGEVIDPNLTFAGAAKISVLSTNNYVVNMVGQFGWMDTFLETWVYMAFAAGAGVVTLLALAAGTWRERTALVLVAGLSLVLPIVIHASQARYLGIIWQGRYILPVAIGLPLLAGYVLARRLGDVPRDLGVALATVVAGVVAAVQLLAFGENLHRYVNGELGAWLSIEPDAWLPPLPLPLVVLLGLLATAGYGVLLASTARIPAPAEVADGPAEVADGEPMPVPGPMP
ncbi:DUF2142 domain-containing protein [Cellulomonas sp. KRMCY2]|uniref:DUF2142 domain-containing protein n=1 Tax=Cellulomonas sp. KRMCY2 TaxID=1304865 RepID=UPI00045E66F1|nr:DUF2142 domain-containing protein [Cellulomonas sp. KRMCY2]